MFRVLNSPKPPCKWQLINGPDLSELIIVQPDTKNLVAVMLIGFKGSASLGPTVGDLIGFLGKFSELPLRLLFWIFKFNGLFSCTDDGY